MTPFKKTTLALLAATVAATALSAASYAVSAREGGHWGGGDKMFGWHMGGGKRGGHMFERFDANKDGVITQTEIDTSGAAMFTEADANTDGKIDLDEFKAQFVKKSEPMRIRAFQMLDRDGDGQVTKAEYDEVSNRMFSKMDRDDDGIVQPRKGAMKGQGRDHAQMQGKGQDGERMEGRPGKGMGRGEGGHEGRRGGPNPMKMMFATFDQDKDGKVTREEFDTVRQELFASADAGTGSFDKDGFSSIWAMLNDDRVVRMFQRMDSDGDLGITAEEHQAMSSQMIERMDRNEDGVITKADMRHNKGKHGRGDGEGHQHGKRDHREKGDD